ncbi:LpqB family beta-propeller domain-containing protein [Saccharopolyspora sp. K220]|uniref:LpqB family beta-propeller domain-containing protein n=1 Tax=Saccharopolyspora soli TaxID=2926618 RepID=UPI001F59DF76|nr:LpqB family beta-propeller domain-containing protein [Saccharopolyspora soli]MCI2422162.1 LpqB family beta-propeller domain-containing protein [Saccharopolyspora soli]
MGVRSARRLAALVVLLLGLSACASIPQSSNPKAVKEVDESNATAPVSPPPSGADPLALVRSFVDLAAAPESNHEAARLHLTPAAHQSWGPLPGLLIVDNVDTIPAPQPMPLPDGVQMVTLQADKVGRLLPDSSFVPEVGEYQIQMRVERQPDGQWRIATPPPELVASRGSFNAVYRPVPIYFLDHDSTGVVPDLRYVVSQPASTLPRRVIDLLTTGPSEGLRSAVNTAIPPGVHPKTNTSEARDGALEVNLSDLGDVPRENRRLIAAQVVFSLQTVSNARVRIKEEGLPLLPDVQDLRPTDLVPYEANNVARPDLPGLAVVDERLVTLDRAAQPIPGPAGSGEYEVVRAGQSADGSQIAAVARRPGGVVLRVGPYGGYLPELPTVGAYMSKPTWRGKSEVWTVVDGRDVVRALSSGGNSWTPQSVDARQLTGGRSITDLRLSRDGTRVAAVIDGQIVVAGVSDEGGHAVLQRAISLPSPEGVRITGVEWRENDSLVAITDSNATPVYEVSVDGFRWDPYTAANLGQPLTAVTVGSGARVVVADRSGLWESRDTDDVWSLLQVPIRGGSIPFFPG